MEPAGTLAVTAAAEEPLDTCGHDVPDEQSHCLLALQRGHGAHGPGPL